MESRIAALSLSLFLFLSVHPRSLVSLPNIPVSFSLLSLTALAAKCGGRRKVTQSMTHVKESGMRVGWRGEEKERERKREEFIIMSQGVHCPLGTICCSREK